MNIGKRIRLILCSITLALLVSLLGEIADGNLRFGSLPTAKAAGEAVSKASLSQLFALHDALNAGEPADRLAVSALRAELSGLTSEDASVLDPIWETIRLKLPASVDQEAVKSQFFLFLRDMELYLLQPQTEFLNEIRSNSDYKSALQILSSAAGQPYLTADDFLLFQLGDGGTRLGVEGTLRKKLYELSPFEINTFMQDKQTVLDLYNQKRQEVLGQAESYQVSRVLRNLGVKPAKVQEAADRLSSRLQTDDRAFAPLAVAYIRSNTTLTVSYPRFPSDGTVRYVLNVFGAYVSPQITKLNFSQVAGRTKLDLFEMQTDYVGSIVFSQDTIDESGIVQLKLLHSYDQQPRIIYEKELRNPKGNDVSPFGADFFMEQTKSLYDGLTAGNPVWLLSVRDMNSEVAALDGSSQLQIIDPVWSKIAPRLNASVDKEAVKLALFQMMKEAGSFDDATTAEALQVFAQNKAYNTALQSLYPYGYIDANDFLLFLLGDGKNLKGIKGAWQEQLTGLNGEQAIPYLQDQKKRDSLLYSAIQTVNNGMDGGFYRFGYALGKLGVTVDDFWAATQNILSALPSYPAASGAKLLAQLHPQLNVSLSPGDDGLSQRFSVRLAGSPVPNSMLTWTKLSGSGEVLVSADGVASIPRNVNEGTALIQASIADSSSGVSIALFQQEVTLTNENDVDGNGNGNGNGNGSYLDQILGQISTGLVSILAALQNKLLDIIQNPLKVLETILLFLRNSTGMTSD